jgi:hypothetical protein
MIGLLLLLLHVLVSPFKTQARLEAEIVLLRHQFECAASARTHEAVADGGGPLALRLALSAVSVGVERCHDCPTGDGHPVASDGVPPVLALEVALSELVGRGYQGRSAA